MRILAKTALAATGIAAALALNSCTDGYGYTGVSLGYSSPGYYYDDAWAIPIGAGTATIIIRALASTPATAAAIAGTIASAAIGTAAAAAGAATGAECARTGATSAATGGARTGAVEA